MDVANNACLLKDFAGPPRRGMHTSTLPCFVSSVALFGASQFVSIGCYFWCGLFAVVSDVLMGARPQRFRYRRFAKKIKQLTMRQVYCLAIALLCRAHHVHFWGMMCRIGAEWEQCSLMSHLNLQRGHKAYKARNIGYGCGQ